MVQRESKIYNFEKIEKLFRKLDNFSDTEKWKEIGTHFDKTPSAVRRWYYRQLEKQKNNIIKVKEEITFDIPTDVIRTVYLLLFGKGCRVGYYQAIKEIKAFLDKL